MAFLLNQIEIGHHTDRGVIRQRNEDSYTLPLVADQQAQYGILLAVADGVGGCADGDVASRETTARMQAIYYAAAGAEAVDTRLHDSFESVHRLALWDKERAQTMDGRLTTLVAAVLHGSDVWVGNTGDSRAYLVKSADSTIHQLTEDHIDAHSQITQAIGYTTMQPDLFHEQWEIGDCLILCSDGVRSVTDAELAKIVLTHTPQNAAQKIIKLANQRDGSDNSTVVIAKYVTQGKDAKVRRMFRPKTIIILFILGLLIGGVFGYVISTSDLDSLLLTLEGVWRNVNGVGRVVR